MFLSQHFFPTKKGVVKIKDSKTTQKDLNYSLLTVKHTYCNGQVLQTKMTLSQLQSSLNELTLKTLNVNTNF